MAVTSIVVGVEQSAGDALKGHLTDAVGSQCASTRGHRAFERTLLGSVATHVSRHATCPVVVVPTPAESTP